eukprot:6827316-Pyramimonas_sp.AAC.1
MEQAGQQKVDQAKQVEMEQGSSVTAALNAMNVRPLLAPSSPPPRPLPNRMRGVAPKNRWLRRCWRPAYRIRI